MKKKLLFWIDSSLYNFFNAKFIQEEIDCDIYSIYDITDNPKKYFQSQKIVNFNDSWFFHDQIKNNNITPDIDYLNSFEEKFGINLWVLAYNERNFYEFNKFYNFSSDEILSILEQECKFFEKVLETIKPDFLIMPQPYFHHDHLLFIMCKKLGIKCLLIKVPSLDSTRCLIHEDNEYTPIDFPKSSSKKQVDFETIQNKLKSLKKFEQVQNIEETSKSERLNAVLKYIFSSNSNIDTHYSYYGRTKLKVLYTTFLMSVKGKIRKRFLDKNSIYKIPSNEKFIYFPLHQEEEESTLIGAPFFSNQIEVIKNIIKSMPIGYKLYVKESPVITARDGRKISEYKKLLSFPNLRLIHNSVNPFEILKKCSLVITIVGSSGLEAAYYLKPSIVLTDTSYSNLNSVKKLKNFEDLSSLIKNMLTEKFDYSDVSDYHEYIQKNSFSFNFHKIWTLTSNHFHFGGAYVDVIITDEKIKTFLEKCSDDFRILSSEFSKKIQNSIN